MNGTRTRKAWHGRKTPRSVFLKNAAAGCIIRTGGVFVVGAVLGICVFLVYVVLPLFGSASVGAPVRFPLPVAVGELLTCELNEYRSLGVALLRSGEYLVFDPRSGTPLRRERLTVDALPVIRSHSRALGSGQFALGLADGSVALGRILFEEQFVELSELSPALQERARSMAPGDTIVSGAGVIGKTPMSQLRRSTVSAAVDARVTVADKEAPAAVTLVAARVAEAEDSIAAYLEDGRLALASATRKKNLMTGKTSVRVQLRPLPLDKRPAPPTYLLMNGRADQLVLAWEDGMLHRYDLRNPAAPVLAERVDLCPDDGVRLTALRTMIGEESLISGDSSGVCAVWFRVPDPAAPHEDGFRLVTAHRLEPQGGAIRALSSSPRDRAFASGADDGSVWLRHLTTARVLSRLSSGSDGVEQLQITPKADGLLALTADGQGVSWPYSSPHPETTVGTVFFPTWYEGSAGPTHTWQSTGGTDDYEPKLGLVPLIFGTLKATIYALVFAVPVAVLAAIYTSEFLSRRVRAVVKPTIELMASLPSVVLGFLAALVIAPLAESWVLSLLLLCLTVPGAMILGSYLWLFLPHGLAFRLGGLPKLAAATAFFGVGIWLAFPLGLWIEERFFLGEFRVWLAPPRRGSPVPAWALLLLPFCLGATWFARNRWILPRLPTGAIPGGAAGELLKGALTLAGGLVLCSLLGWALAACGLDPRDSILGTYVQRNTMIVGFVMGFAVIPIIYTISEDALSAVPEHLRGAALGCGATPWQAAIGVILPTALSGIFSAVMVGLGRAVGETMIVVMAAGNTPIMDLNPFNGLRALSATIAVELPESVKDGTLYRMLFLAALCLFCMTFVVNTVAELVRIRFRKRAFEL